VSKVLTPLFLNVSYTVAYFCNLCKTLLLFSSIVLLLIILKFYRTPHGCSSIALMKICILSTVRFEVSPNQILSFYLSKLFIFRPVTVRVTTKRSATISNQNQDPNELSYPKEQGKRYAINHFFFVGIFQAIVLHKIVIIGPHL
jgi:hypothetical protein